MLSPVARRHRDLASGLTVLALWVAFRHSAPATLDLRLYDETSYLKAGWSLLHAFTLPALDEAPLYAAWYALWHVIAGGGVATYFSQWLGTDLLLTLGLFLLLRRASGSAALGALGVLGWLLLPVTTTGSPRVGFFALLLVVTGALLESKGRAIAGVALLLATLVRPDYVAALALWLAVEGWRLVPMRARRAAAGGALGLMVAAGLFLAFGSWGSGRLWLAFSQHHALHYARQTPGAGVDPWLEHARLTAVDFPHCTRVSEALHANPRAFFGHLWTNVTRLPPALLGDVREPAPWASALLAGVVAAALLALARRNRALVPRTLSFAAMVALPSLLVTPKAVYELPLIVLALLGAILGGREALARLRLPERLATHWAPSSAALALAIALAWGLAPEPSQSPPQSYLLVLHELQAVWEHAGAQARWRMLEVDGGYCAFLDPGRCETVSPGEGDRPLSLPRLIRREGVNAVVVSAVFNQLAEAAGDPEYRRFLLEPERYGFRRVPEVGFVAFYLRSP